MPRAQRPKFIGIVEDIIGGWLYLPKFILGGRLPQSQGNVGNTGILLPASERGRCCRAIGLNIFPISGKIIGVVPSAIMVNSELALLAVAPGLSQPCQIGVPARMEYKQG